MMNSDGTDHHVTPEMLQRLTAIEGRLQTLQESIASLQTLNQRLLQEFDAFKQGQVVQVEAVSKLEKEVRRGRWLRRFWLLVRLLFWLVLIGAVLYYFSDWINFSQFFEIFR